MGSNYIITSFSDVFNSMVLDTYRAIILTVDIYVVAIYCLPYSGGHKVFDSHRRDLPGTCMRHLYGTCTLIEIDS